jgi:hypothetical protein
MSSPSFLTICSHDSGFKVRWRKWSNDCMTWSSSWLWYSCKLVSWSGSLMFSKALVVSNINFTHWLSFMFSSIVLNSFTMSQFDFLLSNPRGFFIKLEQHSHLARLIDVDASKYCDKKSYSHSKSRSSCDKFLNALFRRNVSPLACFATLSVFSAYSS